MIFIMMITGFFAALSLGESKSVHTNYALAIVVLGCFIAAALVKIAGK